MCVYSCVRLVHEHHRPCGFSRRALLGKCPLIRLHCAPPPPSVAMISLVHTAPGHGVDDFLVCQAHKHLALPVLCPVDDHGKYTSEAGHGLEGLDVTTTANAAVIKVRVVQAPRVTPFPSPLPLTNYRPLLLSLLTLRLRVSGSNCHLGVACATRFPSATLC
jgi:hypothetical protein